MARFTIEAKAAKMGGGSTFATELIPRLEQKLRLKGHDVVSHIGSPSGLRQRIQRGIRLRTSDSVLHTGNRASSAVPARQVVCIRNRLLLPDAPSFYRDVPRFHVQRSLVWHASRVADELVVPSQSMVSPLRAVLKAIPRSRRTNIHVIPHGRPNWEAPEARSLSDPPRLLFPSHLARHKNFPLLAQIMREMRHRNIRVVLTLTVSEDELLDGQPLSRLFAGVSPSVRFVGAVDHAELPNLYDEHDICLFGSLCESFGFPLVEAMTMNMPIVASDADWAEERCGEAALYVAPDDPRVWADRIEDILGLGRRENPEGLSRSKAHDWDDACGSYARLLQG